MRCSHALASLVHCSLAALLFVGCGDGDDDGPVGPRLPPDPEGPIATTGTIVVSVSTTGSPVDPTGYSVELDRWRKRVLPEANYSVDFLYVAPGQHELLMTGIADHCAVVGSNPQYATVVSSRTIHVRFEVFCSPPDAPQST